MNEINDDDEEPSEESFAVEEPRVKPKGILYERPRQRDVWPVLFLLAVAVLLSMLFWWSAYGNFLWVSRDAIFVRNEHWRLVSALFTHSDVEHLLSNMPLFLVFGWLLRTYFGSIAFPFVAILAGALANIATLYFYPPYLRLIGASGMVYAMVGLWIAFYIRYEVRHRWPTKIFRALGFSMFLLLPAAYNPNTSYLAHVFGFLFGIMCALVLIMTGHYDRRQDALSKPEHP